MEALAILYMQNQDLVDKSPAEINTMFWETIKQMQQDNLEKTESGYKYTLW